MPRAKHPDSYPLIVRDLVDQYGTPAEEGGPEWRTWEFNMGSSQAAKQFRLLVYGFIRAMDRYRPDPPKAAVTQQVSGQKTPAVVRPAEKPSMDYILWKKMMWFRKSYALCIHTDRPTVLKLVPRSESAFEAAIRPALLALDMAKLQGVKIDPVVRDEVLSRFESNKPIEQMRSEPVAEEDEEAKLDPAAAKLYGVED